MRKLSVGLCASVALGVTCQVQAQTGSVPPSPPQSGDTIIVDGRRMPTAEAPRSATCEALVRNDPLFRAQLEEAGKHEAWGPLIYLPTRMPRNPDYNAAPLSPVGSPLPEPGKSRFGVSTRSVNGESNADAGSSAPEGGESNQFYNAPETADERSGQVNDPDARMAAARAICRGGHMAGYSSARGVEGQPGLSGLGGLYDRIARSRAEIVRHDRTLPTAFYLFDQNRFVESFTWFRKAAAKLQDTEGGDEAQLFVGKLYLFGLKERSDPAEGVKWLKKVANGPFNPRYDTPVFDPKQPERTNAVGEAAVLLGNLYRTGFKGVSKDLEQSRKWFERAYAVGHLAAAKTLGDIHLEGIGTPRDARKAATYYKKVAKFGLPTAQFALAELLYAGEDGVKRDLKQALLWYQAAAKAEHPGALYALARAYDLGEGIKSDQQMALGLYKTAALKGHSGAITAMGTDFYEGRLLPKDPATARKWFEQSANAADPDGTFNLAAMMARGEGGPRDVVQAWALMKRASALGNETAPTALAALETKMTPAEKQAATAIGERR